MSVYLRGVEPGTSKLLEGMRMTAVELEWRPDGVAVLVTGAAGNVGRSAVFTAKSLGATVIAGVLRSQLEAAASLGANETV